MKTTYSDALRAARRSSIKRHKTGAAIYDHRWRLLAIGWSHRSGLRINRTPQSMHAEQHAISRCDMSKARYIVVATLTMKNNITCGKPCNVCSDLIEKYDLEVFHTESFAMAA